MPRASLLDFGGNVHKGLWVTGPRERTPRGFLRRLDGLNNIRERELRSRNGTTQDAAIAAAHSVTRYNDVRYQGATTILNKAGASISTGFDGTPLEFSVSEPRFDTASEYMFVSGGGKLEKVLSGSPDTVQKWGIDPPSDAVWGTVDEGSNGEKTTGVTGGSSPDEDQIVDTSDQSLWSEDNVIQRKAIIDTDLETSNQQAVEFKPSGAFFQEDHTRIRYNPSPALDLSQFLSGQSSPNSDTIQFFIRSAIWRSNTRIRLRFKTSSSNVYAERMITVSAKSLDANGQDYLVLTGDWQLISLKKSAFELHNDFSFTSASITQVEWSFYNLNFEFEDVGDAKTVIQISDTFLNGAAGTLGDKYLGNLNGTYKYRITFRNSVTGNRSDPSPATMVAANIVNGTVTLGSIPTSVDSQVDQVEIWRTLGDGTQFFLLPNISGVHPLTNGTATFEDGVSDVIAPDDADLEAYVLTSTALPLDNEAPHADFDQHIIDALQAFWITNLAGETGRLYFSPSGRPESVSGFISVGRAGDPLHRLVVYRGQRFVFGESAVYRIDTTPSGILLSKKIEGAPGVPFANRRTVVPTPAGVMYQATDGVRAFDGNTSRLANIDAIGTIFRGETAENLTAFEGIVATFARGEYVISDGTQSLALNVQDLSWREIGFDDITALFYEWDTDSILAGRTSNTELIEEEGVFTDYNALDISFEWETPALDFPNDQVLLVQYVYSDADTQGQTVTPTLVHLDGTITLTTLTNASRAASLTDVFRLVQKPGVRYTGTGASQFTLFDAEIEFYEVVLGVKFPDGERIEVLGRTTAIGTEINFIVDPPDRRLEGEAFIPFIDRLQLDINTGGFTVTPVILTAEGNEIVAADVVTSSRETVEITLERTNAIRGLRLEADFTQNIQLFAAEMTIRNTTLSLVVL